MHDGGLGARSMLPDTWEYRAAVELRASGNRRLEGYAAVFGARADIGGRFTETIRSGAFTAALANNTDILALVDHDASRLLARTRSGTLQLSQDARGLAFALTVPNTTLGNDIIEMAQRGDIGGASFSFRATDEHWTGNHRELRAVDLFEVSIVQAHPAYISTEVHARSRDLARTMERARLHRLHVATL